MVKLTELTKKNQEFIKIATHQFQQDSKSQAEIDAIFEGVLPSILDNQKKGLTARHSLGAPTTWAASFSQAASAAAATVEENDNFWLMWLESSLLILAWLAIVNGIMNAFSNRPQAIYGLASLIVVSLSGGAALYALYHFVYRDLVPGQKIKWGQLLLTYVLVFSSWVIMTGVSSLIPQAINPQLPGFALIVVGGLALAGRHYLKKKYTIKSALNSLSSQRQA